MLLKIGIVL